MPFFVVNADNKRSNNGLVKNDDEYDDFTNTTDYTEIHIATTPALIIVKNGSVSNFISSKKTQTPASEIRSYIQNLM